MSKAFVFVDNSNVFIEGRRVSAVKKGLAKNIYDAMNKNILDHGWNIDYGRLHEFVCGNDVSKIGGAYLWGSPPPGDSFWEMVRSHGFDVKTYDRNFQGKEKKIDTDIAFEMAKKCYSGVIQKSDEITLVAGDKDYAPAIQSLRNDGFTVDVVFWGHAARELKEIARQFISLDEYLEFLSWRK